MQDKDVAHNTTTTFHTTQQRRFTQHNNDVSKFLPPLLKSPLPRTPPPPPPPACPTPPKPPYHPVHGWDYTKTKGGLKTLNPKPYIELGRFLVLQEQ
jgi:hypothetical protein